MSIEIEQALLGSVFLQQDVYEKCLDGIIFEFHFTENLHKDIFLAFKDLYNKKKNISPLTILPYIKDHQAFIHEENGANIYLADLIGSSVGISVVNDYIDALIENHKKEKYFMFLAQCQSLVKKNIHIDQVIQETEVLFAELSSLNGGGVEKKVLSFEESSDIVIQDIDMCQKGIVSGTGLTTSIPSLDEMITGLKNSDLVIVAGRPAMGKTAFAVNIGFNLASEKKAPVCVFSLEMSHQQLSARIISSLSSIESHRLYSGNLSQYEFENMIVCTDIKKKAPLFIDDRGGQDISSIISTAKFMKRKHGIELIIIDYIQLIKAKGFENNKVQEVTYITKELKSLAKELNVPVVALSQLSRGVESREEKRPVMGDLRDSGSIEQDADIVMMVYRDEYYEAQKKPQEGTAKYLDWEVRMGEVKNKAEIIVAKNRHGGTGSVAVNFEGRFTRFHE